MFVFSITLRILISFSKGTPLTVAMSARYPQIIEFLSSISTDIKSQSYQIHTGHANYGPSIDNIDVAVSFLFH